VNPVHRDIYLQHLWNSGLVAPRPAAILLHSRLAGSNGIPPAALDARQILRIALVKHVQGRKDTVGRIDVTA
jgi:hypothetical protein